MSDSEEECDSMEPATVLHRRTDGNAFFLVQMLRTLHERGFVRYSISKYQWEWDIDRIVFETEIADNVLDMVTSKIRRLDEDLQLAIKSAACLGSSRFDVGILAEVLPDREYLGIDPSAPKERANNGERKGEPTDRSASSL